VPIFDATDESQAPGNLGNPPLKGAALGW